MKTNRRKGCQILEPSRPAHCEKLALKLSYRVAVQMKRGCLPAVFHRQERGKKFHASAFSYT